MKEGVVHLLHVCTCVHRERTQVSECALVHILILDTCACIRPVCVCVFIYLCLALVLGFGEICEILSSMEQLRFHQFKWNKYVL